MKMGMSDWAAVGKGREEGEGGGAEGEGGRRVEGVERGTE